MPGRSSAVSPLPGTAGGVDGAAAARWNPSLSDARHAVGVVGVHGPDSDAVHAPAQFINLLADVQRHENERRVVLVTARIEDARHRQRGGRDQAAQLLDLGLVGFLALELFEGAAEVFDVARGIDGQGITHCQPEFVREVHADDALVAVQVELALAALAHQPGKVDDARLQLGGDAADHRRQPPVVGFGQHGTHHVGRRRHDAGRGLDLRAQAAPAVDEARGLDLDVRIEAEHLALEFGVVARHDRDDHDGQHHPQGDAHHAD